MKSYRNESYFNIKEVNISDYFSICAFFAGWKDFIFQNSPEEPRANNDRSRVYREREKFLFLLFNEF